MDVIAAVAVAVACPRIAFAMVVAARARYGHSRQ